MLLNIPRDLFLFKINSPVYHHCRVNQNWCTKILASAKYTDELLYEFLRACHNLTFTVTIIHKIDCALLAYLNLEIRAWKVPTQEIQIHSQLVNTAGSRLRIPINPWIFDKIRNPFKSGVSLRPKRSSLMKNGTKNLWTHTGTIYTKGRKYGDIIKIKMKVFPIR